MGRLVWFCVVAATACGRVAFEARGDAADRGGDAGDASSDSAAVACPEFALLCDDFESGTASKWTGTTENGPATLAISGAAVHAGAFALDTTVGTAANDGGRATAYYYYTQPASGVLAIREWLSVASPLELFNMLILVEHETTQSYVAAGGDNNGNWVVTDDGGAGPVDHIGSTPTPPVGTWACVELVYTFAGTGPAHVSLYVNDVLAVDDDASDPAPVFTDVQVGIGRADVTGIHVYTDDVVIADRRIGCE